MKRFLAILAAIVGLGLLSNSCLPPEIEVESVTLNETSVTMLVGEIKMLTATVLPTNATFPEVTWESSNPSVATVKEGFVSALQEGTATITATAWGVSSICVVKVISKEIPVETITLDQDAVQMEVGELFTLNATIEPANATIQKVEWTSSNTSVAQVTTEGTIVALAEGTTSITASAGGKFASCPVTVVSKSGEITVTGIELDVDSAEIVEGSTLQITATVSPAEAAGKTVTWTSSDSSVATVRNGLVTALKPGSVVITASCEGKQATCRLTVIAGEVNVTSVTVSPTTLSLEVGGKATLKATVLPENATDKTVSWSSDKPSVASVDDNGEVTAVATGSATITVTTKDGNKTATCEVTVAEEIIPVTSVTLSQKTLSLTAGEDATLTATVSPDNSTDKTVTWTSSNTGVATVDNNGKVTAIKAGTATITASCGGKSDTCTVTVVEKVIPATGVELDLETLTLEVGDKATIKATVLPEDATNKDVTWSSDNASVASVNANGEVTAVAPGNATITATTKDGEFTASCDVTVTPRIIHVTSLTLYPTSLKLKIGETATVKATVLPNNATDKTVFWYSSNEAVASVDDNGFVTALALGTTRITATCDGKRAICDLTVTDGIVHVSRVEITPSSLELLEGEKATLTATVHPSDANDKTVTWSSDNESVATVDENGEVTAKALGSAKITVT